MQIKSIITILPLIILSLASCDKDLKDEYRKCYDIKNMDNCEKSGYCTLQIASVSVINNNRFISGKPFHFNNMEEANIETVEVCFPKGLIGDVTVNVENTWGENTLFRDVTKNFLLKFYVGSHRVYSSLLFDKWKLYDGGEAGCDGEICGGGNEYNPICGGNRVEGVEECDGTMLGIMESCSEFSAVTGMGDFGDGTIGCKKCHWDFSQCTVNGTGGEL